MALLSYELQNHISRIAINVRTRHFSDTIRKYRPVFVWLLCVDGYTIAEKHRPVHNSMSVQPEIKMADMKPETRKPDFADGIYVKFPRNLHTFCIEQHTGTNVSTARIQGG